MFIWKLENENTWDSSMGEKLQVAYKISVITSWMSWNGLKTNISHN